VGEEELDLGGVADRAAEQQGVGAQRGHHVVADPIAQRVGVPLRPVEQPLQPVGRPVPHVLGQLMIRVVADPASSPRHTRARPHHHAARATGRACHRCWRPVHPRRARMLCLAFASPEQRHGLRQCIGSG
jgi:hypothetical protein